jgi:two-component system, LytTR family, sensor kinase
MESIKKLIAFIPKYKILHIIFWSCYFIQAVHQRQQLQSGSFEKHIPIVTSQLLSQLIAVYIICYRLIPRLLEQNKIIKFFLSAAAVIVIMTFTQVVGYKALMHFISGRPFITSNIIINTIVGIADMAIVVAIFVTVTFLSSIYTKDQLNKNLQKEKLETELNFLKSQTSPHFLFNALNSIYVLIDIDKKKAREILLRFSGLLGYQLYECNGPVYLSKELEFMDNYIALEKIRKKNLTVTYNRPAEVPAFEIMPFLLIPLIENAFKHVSRKSAGDNYITINIEVTELKLQVEVLNSYEENEFADANSGGIGLTNIRRRLDLLYADKHELKIEKDKNVFKVKLIIHADENKLHHH